jgi:hypothetical protein
MFMIALKNIIFILKKVKYNNIIKFYYIICIEYDHIARVQMHDLDLSLKTKVINYIFIIQLSN